MAALDLSGKRFGRLVAVQKADVPRSRTKWVFRCDCGAEIVRIQSQVTTGGLASCGCLARDLIRSRSLKHGHAVGYKSSRTRLAYGSAKQRCFNPKKKKYQWYGARGITMCERWRNDFSAFLADMGECPEGLTLERQDVNGHYEPGNCYWATPREQARNKTNNISVPHEGRTLVLKDFAEVMGVPYRALHKRVRDRGQDPHAAVNAMRKRATARP